MSKGDKPRPLSVPRETFEKQHPFPVPTARPCPSCGGKHLEFRKGKFHCKRCGRAV